MVAPLKKKNTLEQTGFTLTEEGFTYKGISYHLNDVVEAKIFRHRLETKQIGIGSYFTHSISVIFSMKTGENVQLTEQPTFFSNSKLSKVERIQEIFNVISEKTFKNRLQKYLIQLENQGYFEYSGWHFDPEHSKIINTKTKRAYLINEVKLMKSYGFIEVVESNGIGSKIRRNIKGKVGINTLGDGDVFFALLKHLFGLSWR
ncbi:MAG: hypothetical protein D3921_14005 [Candidatus Electrothrix sp. AW1]|nr:hypothetical protein [Candidatus Electrothrix sp. AX1]MCI5183608.1 hypothetical protein [Candidatus Electrothrix gigas]